MIRYRIQDHIRSLLHQQEIRLHILDALLLIHLIQLTEVAHAHGHEDHAQCNEFHEEVPDAYEDGFLWVVHAVSHFSFGVFELEWLHWLWILWLEFSTVCAIVAAMAMTMALIVAVVGVVVGIFGGAIGVVGVRIHVHLHAFIFDLGVWVL